MKLRIFLPMPTSCLLQSLRQAYRSFSSRLGRSSTMQCLLLRKHARCLPRAMSMKLKTFLPMPTSFSPQSSRQACRSFSGKPDLSLMTQCLLLRKHALCLPRAMSKKSRIFLTMPTSFSLQSSRQACRSFCGRRARSSTKRCLYFPQITLKTSRLFFITPMTC